MNKLITGIISAAAIASSAFAVADELPLAQNADASLIKSSGFYINANTGYGKSDANLKNYMSSDSDLSITKRSSFAWSANLGYQFNPFVALEVGYLDLPKVKASPDSDDTTAGKAKFSTDAYTLAVKALYPINENFDVFGKVGAAYQTQEVDYTGTTGYVVNARNSSHHVTPLFAVGAEYNVNQNWALGVQGVTTLKGSNQYPATYTALAGLTYKF